MLDCLNKITAEAVHHLVHTAALAISVALDCITAESAMPLEFAGMCTSLKRCVQAEGELQLCGNAVASARQTC